MICDGAAQVDIRNYRSSWPLLPSPCGAFIEVSATPCHFGGERLWWICPRCRRRCAIIYLSSGTCRVCAGGRYRSELLSPEDRLMRKAFQLRERLGQTSGGLFGCFPDKPKGLHWATYNRLVAEGEAIERQLLEIAAARFGCPVGDLI